MSRRIVAGMVVAFLLMGCLALAFSIQPVKANGPVYIRADGSVEPSDAPISTFDNVTYTLTGNIVTDVDGIVVERDNIVIDGAGYTVQGPGSGGSGSGSGIVLWNRNNVTVKSIAIEKFNRGLDLYSNNTVVSRNNMTSNYYGIFLFGSYSYTISENNIENNVEGIFSGSSNNTISGNNLANNEVGIYLVISSNNNVSGNTFFNDGLFVGASSGGNRVDGNFVNGKPLVYLEGVSDYAVDDAGQVILINCDNILVENLNLSSTTVGVELWGTNNARIANNNMTANNWYGILFYYSSENTVSGNNITENNEYGIEFAYSSNNTASGNKVRANDWDGIALYESSNNSIAENNMTDSNYGVYLALSSDNNTAYGNNIANNDHGIYVDSSDNNSIFHNNFLYNTYPVNSDGSTNVWDDGYPSGGNYWSNYTGVDADNDGIGDTAHTIDASNTDRYPLMGIFSDFNATLEQGVQTICNSSISDFQYGDSSIRFNVTGEDGTAGFCRICIPTAVMNATYRVFVNGTEVSYNVLSCSNSTHSFLYFNYTHSTEEVLIIPEFPSVIILPLLMVLTMLAVVFAERKIPRRGRKDNC